MARSLSMSARGLATLLPLCGPWACRGESPRADTESGDDGSATSVGATETVTQGTAVDGDSEGSAGDSGASTTASDTTSAASDSDSGTTGAEVGCEGDWIAAWLEEHPLGPGEWSGALEGMDGLNEYHDPEAREGTIRYNNRPIDGDTITFSAPHTFELGDDVLLLQTTLSGEVHQIVAATETTITIDGSVDTPGEVNVLLFPDYYTRTIPFEDELGGHFLDWNAQFYYDALTGMHTIGGGVGSSPGYADAEYKTWRIRYDPCENRWYKRWNPLGVGSGHHYASNALDPTGRRYFRGEVVFDLDDDDAEAAPIPDTPDDNGGANTFVYHEGLARLYRMTSNGRVRYWDDDSGWSERETFGGMDNHPISAYLSATQTVVFGGGNQPARSFYKIGPDGVVSALDDIPDEFSSFHAVSTMILDVGFDDRLVIMRDDYESGTGNPSPELWWLEPDAPSGEQWQISPDVISPELASYGGSKRELGATALRHLGVVMVMRHWAGGSLDAEDPALRRAAVWLYRPSPE